jgi:Na+/H+ antiporter NhaC
MLIKFIYTLFLALLIALFVGLGIDSFYQSPKAPEYPSKSISIQKPGCEVTEEQQKIDQEFNQLQEKYSKELKTYNRNISIVALVSSIVILVFSLTFMAKIKMIADGILLGGVFTTAYGIIRGLMSDNSYFRFLVVTIGLIVALVLGYVKFIRPQKDF